MKLKSIFTLLAVLFLTAVNAQHWHPDGAKFNNATEQNNTPRIPVMDETGLVTGYISKDTLTKQISDLIDLQLVTDNGQSTTNNMVGKNLSATGFMNSMQQLLIGKNARFTPGADNSFTSGRANFGIGLNNTWYFGQTYNGSAYRANFPIGGLTNHRYYTLPDKNGTFAMLDDVTIPTLQNVTEQGNVTDQNITAPIFYTPTGSALSNVLTLPRTAVPFVSGSTGIGLGANDIWYFNNDHSGGVNQSFRINSSNLTQAQQYILQDKPGTIAHLDDIPADVDPSTYIKNKAGAVPELAILGIADLDTIYSGMFRVDPGLVTNEPTAVSGIMLAGAWDQVGKQSFQMYSAGAGASNLIYFRNKTFHGAWTPWSRLLDEATADNKYAQKSSGTFTPTLVDSGGGATYTAATNESYYKVIDNICYVRIRLTGISTTGTASGNLQMSGMPFTAEEDFEGSFTFTLFTSSDGSIPHALATSKSSTTWDFLEYGSGGSLSAPPSFSGGFVTINGFYYLNQ